MHPVDPAIFLVLVVANLGLGLYFAFFKNRWFPATTGELFLGGRTLQMIPLSLSTMASMCSALGIVGVAGHMYSYGLHIIWSVVPALCIMPVFANVIFPVLYRLRVTSVFEVSMGLSLATLSPLCS